MGIGAKLREAREAKEISLDSLQETTKIQKRYLVAIEEENFSILPGKFYAKAFIREYAVAVGLDPNELMEEYKADIPSLDEDATTQYTKIHRSRKDNMPTKSSAIFSFIPTLFVIILIIGIFFLVWWFLTSKTDDESNIPTPGEDDKYITRPDTEEDTSLDSNADLDDQEDTDTTTNGDDEGDDTPDDGAVEEKPLGMEVVEAGTTVSPTSTIELTNVGDTLLFEFEANNAQVWLDVKDGNDGTEQVFFSGMVKPTEKTTVDLTGQQTVYLNVGYAPNLTITINGEALTYPIDPNKADVQRIWLNVVKPNE